MGKLYLFHLTHKDQDTQHLIFAFTRPQNYLAVLFVRTPVSTTQLEATSSPGVTSSISFRAHGLCSAICSRSGFPPLKPLPRLRMVLWAVSLHQLPQSSLSSCSQLFHQHSGRVCARAAAQQMIRDCLTLFRAQDGARHPAPPALPGFPTPTARQFC